MKSKQKQKSKKPERVTNELRNRLCRTHTNSVHSCSKLKLINRSFLETIQIRRNRAKEVVDLLSHSTTCECRKAESQTGIKFRTIFFPLSRFSLKFDLPNCCVVLTVIQVEIRRTRKFARSRLKYFSVVSDNLPKK